MSILRGKSIVLGLTGGIAIYKSATLLRRLTRDYDCNVTVVMTKSAQEFMSPLIFETFSGKEVITDMFVSQTDIVGTRHIDITQSADLVAIIPATANIIAEKAGTTEIGIGYEYEGFAIGKGRSLKIMAKAAPWHWPRQGWIW